MSTEWEVVVSTAGGPPPVRVPVRGALTVGRDGTNDIALGDPNASGRHARIEWQSSGPGIVDLGSRNGTKLADGSRLPSGRFFALKNGDTVTVGKTSLRFESRAEPEPMDLLTEPGVDARDEARDETRPKFVAPGRRAIPNEHRGQGEERPVERHEAGIAGEALREPGSSGDKTVRRADAPGPSADRQAGIPADRHVGLPAGPPADPPVPAPGAADPVSQPSSLDSLEGSTGFFGTLVADGHGVAGSIASTAEVTGRNARILVLDEAERSSFVLQQPTVSIGRSRRSDLRIRASYVSEEHARIDYVPATGNFQITDLGSANGVGVGRVDLSSGASAPIDPDGFLRFGPVPAVLRSDPSPMTPDQRSARDRRIVDRLVADGQLTKGAVKPFQKIARDNSTLLGDELLLGGAVGPHPWCEAARAVDARSGAAGGARTGGGWWIYLLLAAAAGGAYFAYSRGLLDSVLGRG